MSDKIAIEILEDGTISIKTDGISKENHVSADELLGEIAKLAGGGRGTKKKRGFVKKHNHQHNHHRH